ncbi:MAG: ATP-binding cassette domain-containing protein [Propionibacteriales bacterium]|nr:ATP-binding cassette domain-containing protein [Propionibacteriales bacterium]
MDRSLRIGVPGGLGLCAHCLAFSARHRPRTRLATARGTREPLAAHRTGCNAVTRSTTDAQEGRVPEDPTRSPAGRPGSEILTASGVSVSFQTAAGARIDAVDAVDLGIHEGEFVSIIGPSGCGKSTLLRAFGGLTRLSSGTVTLDGERVVRPQPDKIAFVFQDYTLFPWRTVLANTVMGLQFRGVGRREREETARHFLQLVGLDWCAGSFPAELSGGMQQRVAIARALTMNPSVLLMDEPFGALDEQTRTLLGSELARIVEETGKTVVFVTHSLAEAVFLSDRVLVMSARPGQIKDVVEVPAQRPRDESFLTSEVFDRLRRRIFSSLIEEVHRQAAVNEEYRRAGTSDS